MKTTLLGILLSFVATYSSHSQNLIDATYGAGAGSFELGPYAPNMFDSNLNGFMRLSAGSTTILGWTVGSQVGGVDWLTEPSHGASEGLKSLDLAGSTLGSIYTTFPTVVGVTYEVTFDAYCALGSLVNEQFLASAGSTSVLFTPLRSSEPAANAVYQPLGFSFAADSTSSILQFTATITDGFGPVIDNVVVTPVPEPSVWALLIVCGGLALATRRTLCS